MKHKSPVALVLAAVLAVGCGSGGDGEVQITTQGQVQGCLTGNVLILLLLGVQARTIIAQIEAGGSPDVTDAGGGNWNIDVDFAIFGFGVPDTTLTGTVTEPAQEGGIYMFDAVITSSGGPITGDADVGVRIVDELTASITGTIHLNDAVGCNTTLTIPGPEGMILSQLGVPMMERQLAAQFIEAVVSGTLQFLFEFDAGPDVGGTATIPAESQTVTVDTNSSDLGQFEFKLLPESEALAGLINCFERFQRSSEDLIDALDEVLSEALPGGENSENVTIDGNAFTFDDGDLVMIGTISLVPPSVTFSFENDDAGTMGSTDGPVTVLISLTGEGTATINGTVTMSTEGETCSATLRLVNAQFATSGEGVDFEDGLTILTVNAAEDTLQLQINFGDQSAGGVFDLGGVTMLINDTPLPQTTIAAIIVYFGLIDA